MSLFKSPRKDTESNNVLRYDPKQFRGSKLLKKSQNSSWYLKLFLAFVGLSVFLLYLDSSHVRPHLFELLGLRDTRTEIRNESRVAASSEVVKNAIEEAKAISKPCTKANEPRADEGDIADYLKRSNVLLEKIADAEKKFETIKSKSEKIMWYNNLVQDAGILSDFYNEKLVRCYANTQDVIRVSKRADTISKSLNGLNKKI